MQGPFSDPPDAQKRSSLLSKNLQSNVLFGDREAITLSELSRVINDL